MAHVSEPCALQVGSPPTELLWSPRIAASRGSSGELARGAFSTQQTPLRGDSLEGSSYPASPKVSPAARLGRSGSDVGLACTCNLKASCNGLLYTYV